MCRWSPYPAGAPTYATRRSTATWSPGPRSMATPARARSFSPECEVNAPESYSASADRARGGTPVTSDGPPTASRWDGGKDSARKSVPCIWDLPFGWLRSPSALPALPDDNEAEPPTPHRASSSSHSRASSLFGLTVSPTVVLERAGSPWGWRAGRWADSDRNCDSVSLVVATPKPGGAVACRCAAGDAYKGAAALNHGPPCSADESPSELCESPWGVSPPAAATAAKKVASKSSSPYSAALPDLEEGSGRALAELPTSDPSTGCARVAAGAHITLASGDSMEPLVPTPPEVAPARPALSPAAVEGA